MPKEVIEFLERLKKEYEEWKDDDSQYYPEALISHVSGVGEMIEIAKASEAKVDDWDGPDDTDKLGY